jgi:hypothetical protein
LNITGTTFGVPLLIQILKRRVPFISRMFENHAKSTFSLKTQTGHKQGNGKLVLVFPEYVNKITEIFLLKVPC